jgi:hypothetical protein
MPVLCFRKPAFYPHAKAFIGGIEIEHFLGGDASEWPWTHICASGPQSMRCYTQPIASFNRKVLILK